MTSGARGLSPESERFLEVVIETFWNIVTRERLYLLLSDHESWERFVAEATLSREEAEVLREGLNELQRTMDLEAEEHLARKRFLNMFPELKLKIEKHIRKLKQLADEVDRVHRGCTIANVASGSAGAASRVLSILGLVLAPYAAVPCLAASAFATALGAASSVTGLCTSIVENFREFSAIYEANHPISSDTDEVEVFLRFLYRHIDSNLSLITELHRHPNDLAHRVNVIRAARGNPELAVQAQLFTRGLPVSGRTARRVQNTFQGTALAMTRGARITGGVFSVFSFASDVYDLVRHSRHLQEGAKAESAEVMRQRAQELESKLEKLTEFYERLRESPLP
ncbi:apolipoprotein L3-like [Meles meles]|uniref:apolipoprotein L3-like n=1 Tax=Meles meles TaxID=9662 RepID=UPI001E6A0095|nr:apolipoprotein L3-like isoform X1 [Meles meles]XP_045867561.1 apolipoprotein L3-like isoform X1 [Meles meles]XP_045867716.1 apolipoprotein L3-like [Meles meles]XP_045867717.1 apolipoprotein L3-like [Meles meles]XP_045867719.1 apolipoprotein L3-like [Meles meles]XP_045869058.1 apolipoprotein L3-like [Meles meles]XP_045869059.1 apolipoprotein L3-like [Meles meles]